MADFSDFKLHVAVFKLYHSYTPPPPTPPPVATPNITDMIITLKYWIKRTLLHKAQFICKVLFRSSLKCVCHLLTMSTPSSLLCLTQFRQYPGRNIEGRGPVTSVRVLRVMGKLEKTI